jgi:hypothetical protein
MRADAELEAKKKIVFALVIKILDVARPYDDTELDDVTQAIAALAYAYQYACQKYGISLESASEALRQDWGKFK